MTTEDIIHEAGQKLVTITFDYTEADGTNEGTREVEPYSYRETGGSRKFFGFDLKKDGTRQFVVSNIHNIMLTNSHFEPRWTVEV